MHSTPDTWPFTSYMKALAEELIAILGKQLALYDDVRILLEEEREALASKKPDEVLALVRRKETILLQIKTLEESRRLVCARLANEWLVPASSITLGEIVKRVDGPVSHELGNMRSRMADCIEGLRQSNERNARVCQNGIEVIRRIAQQAVEANTHPSYGAASGQQGAGSGTTKAQRAYGRAR